MGCGHRQPLFGSPDQIARYKRWSSVRHGSGELGMATICGATPATTALKSMAWTTTIGWTDRPHRRDHYRHCQQKQPTNNGGYQAPNSKPVTVSSTLAFILNRQHHPIDRPYSGVANCWVDGLINSGGASGSNDLPKRFKLRSLTSVPAAWVSFRAERHSKGRGLKAFLCSTPSKMCTCARMLTSPKTPGHHRQN